MSNHYAFSSVYCYNEQSIRTYNCVFVCTYVCVCVIGGYYQKCYWSSYFSHNAVHFTPSYVHHFNARCETSRLTQVTLEVNGPNNFKQAEMAFLVPALYKLAKCYKPFTAQTRYCCQLCYKLCYLVPCDPKSKSGNRLTGLKTARQEVKWQGFCNHHDDQRSPCKLCDRHTHKTSSCATRIDIWYVMWYIIWYDTIW